MNYLIRLDVKNYISVIELYKWKSLSLSFFCLTDCCATNLDKKTELFALMGNWQQEIKDPKYPPP